MTDADWRLSPDDLDRFELYPCTEEALEEYPFLETAVADFDATGQEHANEAAAREATMWLRDHALHQRAAVTRLLVVDEHIVSFYALVSSHMRISSTENLRQMGYVVGRAHPGHTKWAHRTLK